MNGPTRSSHSALGEIGILLGFLLGSVSRLLAAIVNHVAAGLAGARDDGYDVAPAMQSEGEAHQTSQAVVLSVSRDYSNYEPSIPRVIQFPKLGHLTLWAFRTQKTVRRQIVITNAEMAGKLGGSRFPMADVPWPADVSLESIEDSSIADAEQYLRGKLNVASVPSAARLEAPKPKPMATELVEAAPAAMPAPAKQAARKPYVHVAATVLERTVGRLDYAGIVQRTFGDGQSQQFAADLMTEDVGPKRIHGADIERALEVAGARVGDMVEIDYTGESDVPLSGGRKGRKKHFVVRVIR